MAQNRITPQQASANYIESISPEEIIDRIYHLIRANSQNSRSVMQIYGKNRVTADDFEMVKKHFDEQGWRVEDQTREDTDYVISVSW